jgi:hypothetical protein
MGIIAFIFFASEAWMLTLYRAMFCKTPKNPLSGSDPKEAPPPQAVLHAIVKEICEASRLFRSLGRLSNRGLIGCLSGLSPTRSS